MSVIRKPGRVWLREWKTKKGVAKSAWACDYYAPDPLTGRLRPHRKQFRTQADALAFNARTFVEVEAGQHVPDSQSCTIAEAGRLWIESVKANGRERSTVDSYVDQLNRHIIPRIGHLRLTELTLPKIADFKDRIRRDLSPSMVKRLMGALSRLLGNAQVRGLVARNLGRDLPRDRQSSRDDEPLRIGVDIPSIEEVRAILHAATGRWRPLLIVAAFTGLRSSELRGLMWIDLELTLPVGRLHVRRRADNWNQLGNPKSKSGYRSIPLSEYVVNTLLAWREECPRLNTGERDAAGRSIKLLHYVFCTGKGFVESRSNIAKRGFNPIQIAAGLSEPVALDKKGNPRLDKHGQPRLRGKYSLHALRHFYCSWLIERGIAHKEIQSQMGHSSLVMTLDRYGHLFPRTDDAAEMAAAEAALLGPVMGRKA